MQDSTPKNIPESKEPINPELEKFRKRYAGTDLARYAQAADLGVSSLITPSSQYDKGFRIYDSSTRPYEELQDYKAQSQGFWDALGNGAAKLAAGTAIKTVESAGYLAGGLAGLVTMDFDKVIHNPIVDSMEKINNALNEETQIYQTVATEKDDGWAYYTSAKFLLGDLMGEGGSFALSAWLTGLGAGKLLQMGAKSIGSKLIKAAASSGDAAELFGLGQTSKLSKATEAIFGASKDFGTLANVNRMSKWGAATFATYTEGAFEARGAYETYMQNKEKEWAAVNGGMPIPESVRESWKNEAIATAKNTLALNMLTIPLMEYQYAGIFKGAKKGTSTLSMAAVDAAKGAEILATDAAKAAKTAGQVSKWNRFVDNTKTAMYATRKLTSNAFKEGLQEGIQQGIQDAATLHGGDGIGFLSLAGEALKTFGSQFTDKEYMEQMIAGAIIGSVFGIGNTISDIKERPELKLVWKLLRLRWLNL